MTRSGLLVADGLERRVAARDDVDLGVAAALQRVLDELGDIGLVFDDQNAGLNSQG